MYHSHYPVLCSGDSTARRRDESNGAQCIKIRVVDTSRYARRRRVFLAAVDCLDMLPIQVLTETWCYMSESSYGFNFLSSILNI